MPSPFSPPLLSTSRKQLTAPAPHHHHTPLSIAAPSSFFLPTPFHGRKGWGDDAHKPSNLTHAILDLYTYCPCAHGAHSQSQLLYHCCASSSLSLSLFLLLPACCKLLLWFRCFFSTPLLFPRFCLLCHAHEKLLPLPSRTLSPLP